MDENLRCMSYSVANKCCSYFYQSGCIVPIQDLDKKCNGWKTESQCAWYHSLYFKKFLQYNDKRMKLLRERLRNA